MLIKFRKYYNLLTWRKLTEISSRNPLKFSKRHFIEVPFTKKALQVCSTFFCTDSGTRTHTPHGTRS